MENLKGKNIILFGAGKSGVFFIEQNIDLNIIAIADNDIKKHGCRIGGLLVISPDHISKFDCDVIVITSVWFKGIIKQIDEMCLDGVSVVLPSKREMKGMRDSHPFSHLLTYEIAREMVVALNDLADQFNVALYLDFGTLLGAYRERDFIAWDDDIDFSVNDEQFDFFVEVLRENKSKLPERNGVFWSVELASFEGKASCILFCCNNSTSENLVIPFEIGICRRIRRNDMSVVLGSMPEFFCPVRYFDGYDSVCFFGCFFKTPVNATEYLTFMYGKWQVPNKNFTFAEYPAEEIEYEQYKILSLYI